MGILSAPPVNAEIAFSLFKFARSSVRR